MKTYKILTLGASGSGKTVFLASMFKNLSIQGEDGFFFAADNRDGGKILNSVYTNLIAGGVWPTGTKYSEISEWSFTCRVRNEETLEDYPACKFTYFDYAGGRFTDMDEDDIELQTTIKSSDAILGLLDGQKILALMSNVNDPKLDIFLGKDLPAIIQWMSHCEVPIQFVISKWDLLESKFSLKQINDRLLEIPAFKELVQDRRKKDCPTRLIPVSSVGMGFASVEPDGSMKKIPKSIPHPFQVEVPVSCVIPDRIKQDIIENAKKEQNIINNNADDPGILHKALKTTLKASPFIDQAIELIVSTQVKGEVAKLIASKVDDLLFSGVKKIVEDKEKRLKHLSTEKESALKEVKDETTALRSAVKNFLYIQEEFTVDFPESEISFQ